MYEMARSVRSKDDLKADIYTERGEGYLSKYRSDHHTTENHAGSAHGTMYGIHRYSDFKPAFALARASTSARRDNYKRTWELATDAWQQAFSMSIWNPMRIVLTAWTASIVTRVCHDCDLQRRWKECRGLYPMGFLNNLGNNWDNFPQVKIWLERFQEDDLVTLRGLYQWYEEEDEEKKLMKESLSRI